jgi:hypothetical protein
MFLSERNKYTTKALPKGNEVCIISVLPGSLLTARSTTFLHIYNLAGCAAIRTADEPVVC